MFKSTSPENAADIEALSRVLAETSVGETATYAKLSEAIGNDIHAKYWLLRSAKEKAEKETGGLFETVRTVGIKRLVSSDIPDVGLCAIRKTRRVAKRAVRRLEGVRANDLSTDESQRVIAYRSQLGAISMAADARKTERLVPEVTQSGAVLPVGRVLELFKG